MLRRLPLILAALAGLAALLTLGPVAVAVLLLRSSSDAHGPTLGAHILIALVVVALTAAASLAGWALGRLLLRLARRR
ncbi:MAG: hypothetical protein ACK40O_08710 [Allosphingosinicella sp.]